MRARNQLSHILMKGDCASLLIRWLADRKVLGPQREIERAQAAARAEKQKLDRALKGLSDNLRRAFVQGADEFRKALAKEMPQPADRIRVLLQIFGASNQSWTMLEWIESRAETLFKDYSLEALAPAAEAGLLGTDRQVRRGGARLWECWQSPLKEWHPLDAAKLHRVVLAMQQEARCTDLRQSAMANLRQWSKELSPEELERRLMAGLRDPHSGVRKQAMRVAGELNHRAAIPLLLKVLHGEAMELLPLPAVSAEEMEGLETEGNEAKDAQGAGIAALALGYMKCREAEPFLEAHEKESPLFAVALALMGHLEKLKAEHFQSADRSQELQLAAVEAVVRCQGRLGLEFALKYKQATHWWEEEHVAGILRKMLLAAKAPGKEMLPEESTLKDLARWYEKFGKEYLQMLQKSEKP